MEYIENNRKKVLIADDNKTFLMYMGILLKRMGFNVLLAENGIETIKLLKLMRPDLILLDYQMPEMDGMAVLRYIKADRQISDVSVVVVTSDSSRETAKTAESLESCGYLVKPVRIDDLHDVLQCCLFRPLGFVRRHPRTSFSERVVLTHEQTTHNLYAESLSEGGVYIRKKNPLPVGSEIEVTLPLFDGPISVKGKVIYVKGLHADMFRIPPGMAIEFTNISEADVGRLRGQVKALLVRDIIEDQDEEVLHPVQ